MSYYQQPRGSNLSPHSPQYFTYSKHPEIQETTRFQQITISRSPPPTNFSPHGTSKRPQPFPTIAHTGMMGSPQQPLNFGQQTTDYYQQPMNNYQHHSRPAFYYQDVSNHHEEPTSHYQYPKNYFQHERPDLSQSPVSPFQQTAVSPFQQTAVSNQPLQTSPVTRSGQNYAALQSELLRKGSRFTDKDFPPNDSSLYMPGTSFRDRYSGTIIWKRASVSICSE